MSFEIPTQIELTGTNLLIAGGVLHFLVASFIHFRWLKAVKKFVVKENADSCNAIVEMDNLTAIIFGMVRFAVGPELKILESILYANVKIVGSVLTMTNYKPWKLALYKVSDDDIRVTHIGHEPPAVGPST